MPLLSRRRVISLVLLLLGIIVAWLHRRRRKRLFSPLLQAAQAAQAADANAAQGRVETSPTDAVARKLVRSPTLQAPRRRLSGSSNGKFAAFLSHYKSEAAAEARWLQQELEATLDRRCFLDSDDLSHLSTLKDHVRSSDCLVLLQTRNVLTRPWCIVELLTAIEAGVPIVSVSVTSGTAPYDFAAAQALMLHMDTALEVGTREQLAALGVDLKEAAFKLSNTLPQVISVALSMNESREVLAARIQNIVGAMARARLPPLPPDCAAWLTARGSAPRRPSHGPSHGPPAAATTKRAALASIPIEVPSLPRGFVARPDLIAEMKRTVLHSAEANHATAVTAPSGRMYARRDTTTTTTTAAHGMGGVGKTTLAASVVRDPDVRAAFDTICWVSVGQEPDLPALQQTLSIQLLSQPLPDAARADERLALGELQKAARGMSVLLVLDDVWVAAHTAPLDFLDHEAAERGGSALVVTTRMRTLLDGAAEVQCGMLSPEASIELLLRTGGVTHMLAEPPAAALEAVDLCGRLPLALVIAGGIIDTIGAGWETRLCALLKDEFKEASVEERVVTASLRTVPAHMRAGVEGLFTLLAIFSEDAVIPAAAIDLLAPLVLADAPTREASRSLMRVRTWLNQLLRANLIKGSAEAGVCVHDLVRDCMIARADAATEGGLRSMQRVAVASLLDAFDAGGWAADMGYVSTSLHWHVRQSVKLDVPVHADALLMRALTHDSIDVRRQGAIGIGVDALHSAADACDASGEHLASMRLIWAACAVRGSVGGTELRRAWSSAKQLEAKYSGLVASERGGTGSGAEDELVASRELEIRVLNTLLVATEGGIEFNSKEYDSMIHRFEELAEWSNAQRSSDTEECAAGDREVMNVELGLAMTQLVSACGNLENFIGYNGPPTSEKALQTHQACLKGEAHLDAALAAAPEVALKMMFRSMRAWYATGMPRRHTVPAFDPDAVFGKGGVWLRETIERYDFATMHDGARQVGFCSDIFAWGAESLGLLLFYGDLQAVRVGFAKLLDTHKQMLMRLRQGAVKADTAGGYGYELFAVAYLFTSALFLAGDFATCRALLENTLLGALLHDKAALACVETIYNGGFTWATPEGYRHSTLESYMLLVDGVKELVAGPTGNGANGDECEARRTTLPPPETLLNLAEYHCAWRAFPLGGNHPALLYARLYGERFGNWQATVEVAEGVLRIEPCNPVLRTEAHRLLGRAKAALGDRVAACKAAECAVVEAAQAKYVWLEMRALRDRLRWCEESETDEVRARLNAVVERLAASAEELAEALLEDEH